MLSKMLVAQKTHRHSVFSAIQEPVIGPIAGPKNVTRENTPEAIPRSSGSHVSEITPPAIWHSGKRIQSRSHMWSDTYGKRSAAT